MMTSSRGGEALPFTMGCGVSFFLGEIFGFRIGFAGADGFRGVMQWIVALGEGFGVGQKRFPGGTLAGIKVRGRNSSLGHAFGLLKEIPSTSSGQALRLRSGFLPGIRYFAQDDRRSKSAYLRRFDQLHFAVAGAVQDHHFAFGIAEDKDVAVAEVSLFNRFF